MCLLCACVNNNEKVTEFILDLLLSRGLNYIGSAAYYWLIPGGLILDESIPDLLNKGLDIKLPYVTNNSCVQESINARMKICKRVQIILQSIVSYDVIQHIVCGYIRYE
jgi:hypothetical protein